MTQLTMLIKLANYTNLVMEVPPVQVITRDLVFSRLVDLQYAHADYVPVLRPAQQGDQLILSFYARSGDMPVPGSFQFNYKAIMAENMILPGFYEHLLTMSAGQKIEFNCKLPAEFEPSEFAGQDVLMHLELKQVNLPQMPELDDAFALQTGRGQNLSELLSSLTQELHQECQHDWKQFVTRVLLESVINGSEVSVEQGLLEAELRQIWLKREGQEIQNQGFSESFLETCWQAWLKSSEFVSEAEKRIKTTLVLHAIAEQENLTVTGDELAVLLEPFCQRFGQSPQDIYQELKQSGQLEALVLQLEAEKVIDFLFKNVDLVLV